jgi:hypothetical protein
MIPGLLQTAGYAHQLLTNRPDGLTVGNGSAGEIGRMIAARVGRQKILYEPGRTLTLLMSEGALRTRLAAAEVMAGQLYHLAGLTELGTAKIGVIPFAAPLAIAPTFGFGLYDDIAVVETIDGEMEIGDPVAVAKYEQHADYLAEVALTGSAAAGLIHAIAAEYEREGQT